jgi:hypothetical protein
MVNTSGIQAIGVRAAGLAHRELPAGASVMAQKAAGLSSCQHFLAFSELAPPQLRRYRGPRLTATVDFFTMTYSGSGD